MHWMGEWLCYLLALSVLSFAYVHTYTCVGESMHAYAHMDACMHVYTVCIQQTRTISIHSNPSIHEYIQTWIGNQPSKCKRIHVHVITYIHAHLQCTSCACISRTCSTTNFKQLINQCTTPLHSIRYISARYLDGIQSDAPTLA